MSSPANEKAENLADEAAKQAEEGIVKSPSLMSMTRDISSDLTKLTGGNEEIEEYFKQVDEKNYQKREWTTDMEQAHAEYHQLANEIKAPHAAYQTISHANNHHTTWDQRAKPAKLVIACGKAVVN